MFFIAHNSTKIGKIMGISIKSSKFDAENTDLYYHVKQSYSHLTH